MKKLKVYILQQSGDDRFSSFRGWLVAFYFLLFTERPIQKSFAWISLSDFANIRLLVSATETSLKFFEPMITKRKRFVRNCLSNRVSPKNLCKF